MQKMKCENCKKELREYKDVFELRLCMGQIRMKLCKNCYSYALGKKTEEEKNDADISTEKKMV